MKPQLINTVRELKQLNKQRLEYLEKVPNDIACFLIDNAYTERLRQQVDLVIAQLFGDMAEDVCWFLYEFEAGQSPGPHVILADGKAYTYITDEDYYEYLKNENY